MSVFAKFDDSEVRRELEKLQRNGRDTTSAMRRVSEVLRTAVDDQFETEGGGKWKASARALLQGGKTLQDTGLSAGTIGIEHTKREAAAYSDVPYMIFHVSPEHGGVRDASSPLLRDPFDVDRDDVMEEVEEIILEELSR